MSEKEKIKIVVLETLLELLEHTVNYSPDCWEMDFQYKVEKYLSELKSPKVKK